MQELVVLWTNSNKVTAKDMLFMYTVNSLKFGWWEKVTIIIWGDTTNLAANDEEVQGWIRDAQEHGVNFRACKKCAENLGKAEELEKIGIDVVYIGVGLTEYIKDEKYALITI